MGNVIIGYRRRPSDHGKTIWIRALTGIDTDRLQHGTATGWYHHRTGLLEFDLPTGAGQAS